ncbi:copper amine oxidase N-terminal domain-containing protein [Paenibacillus sp. 2RAB27]|uniref:copper amine oxidase N-terminal domain-containing protein n=1 Tax=Paenibacillus sp. 2RAB27 TaxID=3232991 RepID=UPI003F977E28
MKASQRMKAITGLSLALVMGISAQASAAQVPMDVDVYQVPMHFTFDGKEYAPPVDQQGFIYEGTTYVPIRFISYSLDKAVNWDPNTYTVTIAEPKTTEKINISEYKLNTQVFSKSNEKFDKSKLAPSNLKVYKEKINYVFDGVKKSPSDELPGYIVDGSLFVPIRFFSESVGKTINWDPETYTVSAVTKEEKKPEVKLPEVTKPVTTPPIGGGAGGGGGGGGIIAPTKPSFDSIKAEADGKISSLMSEAQTSLTALYLQYLATPSESLKAKGKAKVEEIDGRFEQIMSDTESKLTSNGYDRSIIDSYRSDYEKTKADQEKALKSK